MKTINTPSKYLEAEPFDPPHTACPGCAMPLAMRYVLRAIGTKIVLAIPPGCGSIIGNYPSHIFKYKDEYIPVLATGLGSTASVSAGFKTAMVTRGDTETEMVAFVGDGGTYDIGMGSLSGVAHRNEDILYVCYDNELYSNTGGQTSSATPWSARTATSLPSAAALPHKKDIISIMAAHRIPYLATATVAFPDDLMRKAKKAKEIKGFRFLHILTPCVAGWLYRSELTVKIARLAVETKLFPLLEVENGTNYTINREPQGLPVGDFLKLQGRYRHLTDAEIEGFQRIADDNWQRLKLIAGCERS